MQKLYGGGYDWNPGNSATFFPGRHATGACMQGIWAGALARLSPAV